MATRAAASLRRVHCNEHSLAVRTVWNLCGWMGLAAGFTAGFPARLPAAPAAPSRHPPPQHRPPHICDS